VNGFSYLQVSLYLGQYERVSVLRITSLTWIFSENFLPDAIGLPYLLVVKGRLNDEECGTSTISKEVTEKRRGQRNYRFNLYSQVAVKHCRYCSVHTALFTEWQNPFTNQGITTT
jgi:hypothetical protein